MDSWACKNGINLLKYYLKYPFGRCYNFVLVFFLKRQQDSRKTTLSYLLITIYIHPRWKFPKEDTKRILSIYPVTDFCIFLSNKFYAQVN